ncbi:MAG TPA: class I SAM-dependent methyltransferase [bacterium]|nr:class I SAM-dependent methyltransferase [bacterium]
MCSEVTAKVREFYEGVPFPRVSFESISSASELNSRAGIYARALDRELPSLARVIDVGCGTAQLLCLLGGCGDRRLFAVDISLGSLLEGKKLASVLGLRNIFFVQADLFNLPFEDAGFDYLFCHGVVHHTDRPLEALVKISRLLRTGGKASIGLYNRYGRAVHRLRRWLWRKGSDHKPIPSGHFYRRDINGVSAGTVNSWFRDQYRNPHEVCISLSTAHRWLTEAGLAFVRFLPNVLRRWPVPGRCLFMQAGSESHLLRRMTFALTQFLWMVRPVESGYFVVTALKEER